VSIRPSSHPFVCLSVCLSVTSRCSTKARSTPATMSKQHCRMLQYRMLLRHCCRFWQQCRSNVRLCYQKRQQCRTSFALKFRPLDKVERCFDNVAQNGNIVEATGTKVSCCFDNVASTLLLVWTGLKTAKPRITQTTVSCTIAQGLLFSEAKDLGEIATGSLPTGATNRSGVC